MDAAALKPGEDFKRLSPSYVIFICAFDPFGEGYYRYTFENRCLETGKPLGDGTRKIFLNTRGTRPEGVPKELIHFCSTWRTPPTSSCRARRTRPWQSFIRELHG